MPVLRLPNILIYLGAVLRPTRLRPDLQVPSISYVDWQAVRRHGYNAVVIDKDNCLTWPHHDTLHPSITKGWANLKTAFGPGNVLVVSNSAGTRKDIGGIAAESVSRALGAPVLLHARPKPGCAADIVAFFRGDLPVRSVSRKTLGGDGWEVVQACDELPVERIMQEGEGQETLLGRPVSRGIRNKPVPRATTPTPIVEQSRAIQYRTPLDHPRVLIIGDRLATDVLLSRRLNSYYSNHSPANASPPVLSIVTTELFKKSDVRPLRWLEDAWLRFGLWASRSGLPRTGGLEIQEWVLPRSVDALEPATVDTTTATTAATSAGQWLSVAAWKNWCLAMVPSRARVYLIFKNSLVRGMRGLVRGVKRLRPSTAS